MINPVDHLETEPARQWVEVGMLESASEKSLCSLEVRVRGSDEKKPGGVIGTQSESSCREPLIGLEQKKIGV